MHTKKLLLSLLLSGITTLCFAENLTIDNQTSYPDKAQHSKIAIQWAASAKEVNALNHAIMDGSELNLDSMKTLTQSGKVTLDIPEKAECFRVIAWSKEGQEPDLLTNWVDIVPNKTYTLKADHLVPLVLMSGTGC